MQTPVEPQQRVVELNRVKYSHGRVQYSQVESGRTMVQCSTEKQSQADSWQSVVDSGMVRQSHGSQVARVKYSQLYYTVPWLYLTFYLTLCSTLLHSITTLLDSTSLYYTIPWFYLTLLHCTMALFDSTQLYYTSVCCIYIVYNIMVLVHGMS